MQRGMVVAVAAMCALGMSACGGDEKAGGNGSNSGGSQAPAVQKKDAHDAAIQKEVAREIKKEVDSNVQDESGNYFEGTVDCIPESDTKLSCQVEGFIEKGFGEDADPDATGEWSQQWEAIVDPDTGRFQAHSTG
jgi:hypothetical protein